MSKTANKENWFYVTIAVLILVMGVFYALLFPEEFLALVSRYLYIILPVASGAVVAWLIILGLKHHQDVKSIRTKKHRENQIRKVEQLIWRNRFTLDSQRSQIMFEYSQENHDRWQQVKAEFIRSKVYPQVPERDVPLNLASMLVERVLSGQSYRNSRLPTYGVQDL